MINVLFVCMGNICRSPTAEIIFRGQVRDAGLETEISIDSAGTGGWHEGNPPDDRAISLGNVMGFDMSHLRARQIQKEDFSNFDYILAMDKSNLYDLREMRPDSFHGHLSLLLDFGDGETGEVPDPYYGDRSDYDRVFELVEPAAKGLLTHIKSKYKI